MAETALQIGANTLLPLRQISTTRVSIAVHGESAFSTQQLVNRYTGSFAFNVPKRLVQSAQCVIQNRPVTPIRTGVGGLPQVLNVIHIAPATERIQILVYR